MRLTRTSTAPVFYYLIYYKSVVTYDGYINEIKNYDFNTNAGLSKYTSN